MASDDLLTTLLTSSHSFAYQVEYQCNKGRFDTCPHLLSEYDIVVTGSGRTASSHTAQGSKDPSDTLNRLHSFTFVYLGWGKQVVLGGLCPPTTGGGSPNGKLPIANADGAQFRDRIELATGLLRLALSTGMGLHELARDERGKHLRCIFPDFVKEQRLMASDLVAVAGAMFKYGRERGGLLRPKPTSDIFHVCGPQFDGAFPPIPSWPPHVAGGHAMLSTGRYVSPPPDVIWKGPLDFPQKPTSMLQYQMLHEWWLRVRVSNATHRLLLESGSSQQQAVSGKRLSAHSTRTPVMMTPPKRQNQRAKMDGQAVKRKTPWTKS